MSICTAPIYKLKELNNLFIEMTSKNCNQRCAKCYITFPSNKLGIKDFISTDTIKQAIFDTNKEPLHCIYLTGGEPMTHPDFNAILRLCLKRTSVCICTNGSFLNEKKIRFLKKVEEEGSNQIFFCLSLAHYDEILSDRVKYRGNYRQNILALKILSGYNFTSVVFIQNHYNLKVSDIREIFKEIFEKNEINNTDIQIKNSYPDYNDKNYSTPSSKTDCMYGRSISKNGVYSCPYLADDYRGRVGTSLKDYSKMINAETDFCASCSANNDFMFTIG